MFGNQAEISSVLYIRSVHFHDDDDEIRSRWCKNSGNDPIGAFFARRVQTSTT